MVDPKTTKPDISHAVDDDDELTPEEYAALKAELAAYLRPDGTLDSEALSRDCEPLDADDDLYHELYGNEEDG